MICRCAAYAISITLSIPASEHPSRDRDRASRLAHATASAIDTGTREEGRSTTDEVDKDDDEVDECDDDAKADDNENDEDAEDGAPQTSGGVMNVCSRLMYVFSSEFRARTNTHIFLSGSRKV